MKDVFIISNYFPPEMGAASNRIFQLAKGLSQTSNVSVVCPFPNYPTGKIFKDFKKNETIDNIKINRLWVYPSTSKNKFIRLFSMLSFSFSVVWFLLTHKVAKTVIINSPPLLVAFTCLLFLNPKKHKLILNVSDLWPKAGLDLGAINTGFVYNMLLKIERYNYKKAHFLLGQSEEIVTHIKTIVPNANTLLYRNFPDFEPPMIKNLQHTSSTKIKVVYAGLLGVAQGVLKLCKHLDFSEIEFHIYGAGVEEPEIKTFIKDNPEKSVVFHGSVSRAILHQELLYYDVTIIPLLNRIYGSVPSKIFEYSRLGLPILYFGGGEGETIMKKFSLGWIAESGNYQELNSIINRLEKDDFNLELKHKIQKTALQNFDIKSQIKIVNNII